MTTPTDVVAGPSHDFPLNAFQGSIQRTKTGPLYTAGLLIVAFAMVLLPLLYLALIAFTAWGVVFHLTHSGWIFEGSSGGGLIRLLVYLGPAVAGAILVFFMLKPFFASQAKVPEPLSLDPAKEPLLFNFVGKICGLVGAPPPCRIDVDCQVNASASLRRGLWSRDLVLTIGLPLASGLNMREFAGVLAHEFGHFAQGAGMRLTYIIRKVNFWFARVVYERDAWDVRLEETARNTDFRLAIILHAARGCVWLTRRILWALMQTGHAISCFMLRQMEYDADSYEAKVAGTDSFESTAQRLQVLNVATEVAYQDVRQNWSSRRLPENLPLLIGHKATSLPGEVHQQLCAASASAKTRWFDTHPCDPDRIKAVRLLEEPGVFRLTDPAAQLFSDFAETSKSVTVHQYEKHLGLDFTPQNLMSAEEILRESEASAVADSMVRRFYGGVNISLQPLLLTGDLPAIPDFESAMARWREVRALADGFREAAEKASVAWNEQLNRRATATSASALAKAGFKLEPAEFGLPSNATSPHEQRVAAEVIMDEARASVASLVEQTSPFINALRERVTLALALAQGDVAGELHNVLPVLAGVGPEMQQAQEIAVKLGGFTLLIRNRGSHSDPTELDAFISLIASQLREMIDDSQKRLNDFIYPFPHARGGGLTVAEYARSEAPAGGEWDRAFLDGDAHVDRLFALHYRLIGRVLSCAAAAEERMEKQSAGSQTAAKLSTT